MGLYYILLHNVSKMLLMHQWRVNVIFWSIAKREVKKIWTGNTVGKGKWYFRQSMQDKTK